MSFARMIDEGKIGAGSMINAVRVGWLRPFDFLVVLLHSRY
jgi:hypothetical protein